MPMQRFLIAPFDENSGLQTDVRPWLIPDEAFSSLKNMYVFRGRVRKRFGSELVRDEDMEYTPAVGQLGSRLRIQVDTTDGAGAAAGNVPLNGATPYVAKVGQLFSIGSEIFTVTQATGTMLITGSTTTATFNTTTGAYNFVGADATTAVFWYPAESVMGFVQAETNNINDEPTYAFDTHFAYQYSSGGWTRLGIDNAVSTWIGDTTDFFWAINYRGSTAATNLVFVSNFNFVTGYTDSDILRYWDGAVWNFFSPLVNATQNRRVLTARIIIPFKDRLLLLNVVENINSDYQNPTVVPPFTNGASTQFGNRCRFSQNGDPTVEATSFLETEAGRGGYIDAPTQEQIISAEFLKDRLIVFFERSTWELVYTGNEVLPFRWQQINTELGVESTFSIVPFDKVVLGIGNVGIHACNGANVERIDQKIPDTVFNIHDESDGPKRVAGIRDYFTEMIYWTFPSDDGNDTFPSQVLIYNYKNGTWALNDDSITAFGYFQNQADRTWESSSETWEESVFTWNDGMLQGKFRSILAGNQEGYTFIINADNARNSPALQITNLAQNTPNADEIQLTIVDHNLKADEYVAIENIQGLTGPFLTIYQVLRVVNSTTIDVYAPDIAGAAGTYTGAGTIARVSRPEIITKQYNFFTKEGRNVEVDKVDFLVDKTVNGELAVEYMASSSDVSLGESTLETRPYDPVIVPLEQTQARLWHRIYVDLEGEVVQLKISLNDTQILDPNIAWSDMQLHAIMFHSSPTSNRFR